MSAAATRTTQQTVLVIAAVVLAVVGMLLAIAFHADVRSSLALAWVIGVAILCGIGGVIGGLLLASARRNVMWILAVAVATTAIMALLATVMQSFAR